MKLDGALSFRIFQLPAVTPALDVLVERMAQNAMPDLAKCQPDQPIIGWVTGRHLLDRNITPDTAVYGGYLRASLVVANRCAPTSLVKAQTELELAACGGIGQVEIIRSVRERLAADAQPKLKAIGTVLDLRPIIGGVAYATAVSDKQADAFEINMLPVVGGPLVQENARTLAMQGGVDVDDLDLVHFTDESRDVDVLDHGGADFLTWCWFVADACGGTVKITGGDVTISIEGPLRFASQSHGAQDVLIQKGNPMISAEAKAALLAGKKLVRARVALSIRGDAPIYFTFDPIEWSFRSLRFPPLGEISSPISTFQDRVESLAQFRQAWLSLYAEFLNARNSVNRWEDTLREINQWATTRRASA